MAAAGAAANPSAGPGSGASSNASSCGADDDAPGKDEDVHGHEDGVVGLLSQRGLSGGRLVGLHSAHAEPAELQHGCHPYQTQYHPFLQRYVDSAGPGSL